jgi:hypothetical protein
MKELNKQGFLSIIVLFLKITLTGLKPRQGYIKKGIRAILTTRKSPFFKPVKTTLQPFITLLNNKSP